MASEVEITVLVDDEAGDGLRGEHGLSLWIKVDGRCILFDTGQGKALVGNARKLGIRLDQTEMIVLSHGHYDHTDGLPSVLALAPAARVVVHRDAFVRRYSIRSSGPAKAVGASAATRAALDRIPVARITRSAQPARIMPSVGVTGTIARGTRFEDVGGRFFLDAGGRTCDSIMDDQALWIETDEGLVVCAGCCHAGLINTLNAAQRGSGISCIRAVIGGFHLVNASAARLERTVDALRAISPGRLAPCHCTGEAATRRLREVLGDCLSACRAGTTFHFGSILDQ